MKKAFDSIIKIRNVGFIIAAVGLLAIIVSSFFFGEKTQEPELDVHNFEISEITDEQIVHISSEYTAYMSSWRAWGEDSDISGSKYEEEDHDITEFSSEKISGIKTVCAT